MNKPDWNIGPADATHWAPAGQPFGMNTDAAFYRIHGDIFKIATEASGWRWDGSVFKFLGPLPAELVPRVAEWDGFGVPPPRTRCELADAAGAWFEVEITAIGRQHILFWAVAADQEGYCGIDSLFRPLIPQPPVMLPSAREEAIERMYRIALEATGRTSNTASMPTRRICEALYDYGCVKTDQMLRDEGSAWEQFEQLMRYGEPRKVIIDVLETLATLNEGVANELHPQILAELAQRLGAQAVAAAGPVPEYDHTAADRHPELVSALKEALYTADNSVTIEMASHLAQELVCQGYGRGDLYGRSCATYQCSIEEESPK